MQRFAAPIVRLSMQPHDSARSVIYKDEISCGSSDPTMLEAPNDTPDPAVRIQVTAFAARLPTFQPQALNVRTTLGSTAAVNGTRIKIKLLCTA